MRRPKLVLASASLLLLIASVMWSAPGAAGEGRRVAHRQADEESNCDIVGTAKDDTLDGKDRDEVICGLRGNDLIMGGGGADTLKGGGGDDTIKGEEGDDSLAGGKGSDTCRQNKGKGPERSCEWPNPLKTCPVPSGVVYDDFGDPRGDHTHQGNDILADNGAEILAPFPG